MYKITPVQINSKHPLYDYCDQLTHAANNLYNVTVFYQRQCLFGLRKEPEKRYDLEKEVIGTIEANLEQMNRPKLKKDGTPKKTRKASENGEVKEKEPFVMPTAEQPWLEYDFLNGLFVVTKNQDYYNPALGAHSAQNVVKEAVQQFKNYRSALVDYYTDKSRYTGEPKPPKYLTKGGMHTVTLSNTECEILSYADIDGRRLKNGDARRKTGKMTKDKNGNETEVLPQEHAFLKLPKTGLVCDLGPIGRLELAQQRLLEVKITPHHGIFTLSVTLGSEMDKKTWETKKKEQEERKQKKEMKKRKEIPPLPEGVPLRACNLDLGVDNLAALTNNIGAECLLFKGLVIKSINQLYNKRIAKIMSEQTKGTTNKFVPTPEFTALTLKRNNQIADRMHKVAKAIIMWCVKHEINTIVVGHNDLWKQNCSMGPRNNQNFVQIPFNKLMSDIEYLAERHGIRYVEQEESYTSKASFLDRDPIPVYEAGNKTKYTFSGVRGPTSYRGHKKVQAIDKKTGKRKTTNPKYRGLYESAKGTIINSDLNGSANTGRKAFPNMYDEGVGIPPDFSNFRVIRFPDEDRIDDNRRKQRAAFAADHPLVIEDEKGNKRHISKRALKRRQKKQSAENQSNLSKVAQS